MGRGGGSGGGHSVRSTGGSGRSFGGSSSHSSRGGSSFSSSRSTSSFSSGTYRSSDGLTGASRGGRSFSFRPTTPPPVNIPKPKPAPRPAPPTPPVILGTPRHGMGSPLPPPAPRHTTTNVHVHVGSQMPPPPPRTNINVNVGPSVPPSYTHDDYDLDRHNTDNMMSKIIMAFIGTFVLFLLITLLSTASGTTKSTIEREPLKPYAAFQKECIDDDAEWIHDRKTLLRGMESFYKDTGIQPALAIYEEINGERYLSDSDIEAFMMDKYDELIGHERGLLVLFCEYAESDWYIYYMAGEDAQTVMDSEACDILIDYVHDLYTNDSYSDEEFFSAVFEKTGIRIMTVTPTIASRIPFFIVGAVVIAAMFMVVAIIKQKHKRDAERAAETERILNLPIDRI